MQLRRVCRLLAHCQSKEDHCFTVDSALVKEGLLSPSSVHCTWGHPLRRKPWWEQSMCPCVHARKGLHMWHFTEHQSIPVPYITQFPGLLGGPMPVLGILGIVPDSPAPNILLNKSESSEWKNLSECLAILVGQVVNTHVDLLFIHFHA